MVGPPPLGRSPPEHQVPLGERPDRHLRAVLVQAHLGGGRFQRGTGEVGPHLEEVAALGALRVQRVRRLDAQ